MPWILAATLQLQHRLDHHIGIQGNTVDAAVHQKRCKLRVVTRRLTTNSNLSSRHLDLMDDPCDRLHDRRISLIKDVGDDFRVSIHSQDELRQVIGSYGEPIKDFGKLPG